jgi:indole-3-glycerol phosphate synthase
MNNILNEIVEYKREFVKGVDLDINASVPLKNAFALKGCLRKGNNIKIISEFKKASPSKGDININADINEYIPLYSKYADAISILTEDKYFKGSLSDVRTARKLTDKPILAKDFYVDPVQVHNALQHGASCILIIVKILEQKEIRDLYDTANELGMDAIIEVHSRDDLLKATDVIEPEIVGINVRNLSDFSINYTVMDEIIPLIPTHSAIVAESGIKGCDCIDKIKRDINAVLIGTSIMNSSEPEKYLVELRRCCG